ncbi:MAG: hypothetical protein QW327_01490 [Candidatus Odinarchaeota archaeon]
MKLKRLIPPILFTALILTLITPTTIASPEPSWSPNIRLTNHAGPDSISILGSAFALDSDNRIHAVAYYGGQIYHIYDNNGYINETVIAQVQAQPQASQEYDASPVIVIDNSGIMHVAYYSFDGNDYEIYYTHSTTTGGFITPVQITDNLVSDGYPKIAVDSGGVVHIIYQTAELIGGVGPTKIVLRYQHSTSTGFTAPVNITCPAYPNMAIGQDILVDKNDNVHITFVAVDGFNPLFNHTVIAYTNNTNGSFSNYDIVDKTYQDFNPSMAVDDNLTVHLVFKGNGSIYSGGIRYQYLYYVNNTGGVFNDSTAIKISSVSFAHSPRVALSPNNTLNIVFYGWNSTWPLNYTRVMYIQGVNGTFSQEYLIPGQELDQYLPSLRISTDNQIHIVYIYGDSTTRNTDIFYVTTSSYYPVGVPEPESQGFLFLIIGVIGIVAGVIIVVLLFKKFKSLEKQVWKPRLEDEGEDDKIKGDT